MKYFISLFMILSILVLSGCGVKNSVKNDLYNNQTCYYQNEDLTKYEQDAIYEKGNETCLSAQAKETKQNEITTIKIIGGTLTFIVETIRLIDLFSGAVSFVATVITLSK